MSSGSTQIQAPRPSDARRAALTRAEEMGGGVPLVSNFFSIDRYYAASEKVLESFDKAYAQKRLDDAYVLGKRFCIFSLQALPTHDYFRSPRFAHLRKRNDLQVKIVLKKVEEVARLMDIEEAEKQRLAEARRKKLLEERIRQQQELERTRYQELQQRITQQKKSSSGISSSNVEQSALAKLQRLTGSSSQLSRQDSVSSRKSNGSRQESPTKSGDGGTKEGDQSSSNLATAQTRRSRWPQQDENGLGTGDDALPPPIPPPSSSSASSLPRASSSSLPPPPSYDQVVKKNGQVTQPLSSQQVASQRTITAPAGGAIVGPPPPTLSAISLPPEDDDDVPLVPPPPYSFYDRDSRKVSPKKVAPARRLPIRELRSKCNADVANLKRSNKIQVFAIDTYQGRMRWSTNGCTVISPLVVSHHLKSAGGVTDSAIVQVIDKECPPLLRDIRNKLELEGDALIIPSDVHDYLVDHKILHQDKFAGACGGNILDPKHMSDFLSILERGETGKDLQKKTGAAFFFHEHVVSIVKAPLGGGRCCFDMVDSMPRLKDANGNMRASRTRCHDLQSLESLLKWYACAKFSETNCQYIDRNAWDEMMADFDPRVFQAFVWTE